MQLQLLELKIPEAKHATAIAAVAKAESDVKALAAEGEVRLRAEHAHLLPVMGTLMSLNITSICALKGLPPLLHASQKRHFFGCGNSDTRVHHTLAVLRFALVATSRCDLVCMQKLTEALVEPEAALEAASAAARARKAEKTKWSNARAKAAAAIVK